MAASQRIEHPLQPVFDARSRVLVLGTMPSPASRTAGFYYGHPQNRFWKVLGALWDEPEPLGVEGRTAFLLAHRIAVWDVLAACDIEGASDASIAHAVPNDLRVIIDHAPIAKVFTTGSKAAALYRRLCARRCPRPAPPTPACALPTWWRRTRPSKTRLPDARPQPCAHAGAHQALTSLRAYTTNATARPTTA